MKAKLIYKKKQLRLKVSSLEESLSQFKDVWDKVERGEEIETPLEIMSFENALVLMKMLSPKRLELIRELHEHERISIRQLAKQVHRDYSNVHHDVQSLYQIGLILKDKTGKYYVPWDTIVAEIPLYAHSVSKPHRYTQHHSTHRHTMKVAETTAEYKTRKRHNKHKK